MIHEGISHDNAIARVAMTSVRMALEAGWQVTVVAKVLDESLRDRVEWLRLTVPPRGFFVQWVTARHFIQKALGGRTFDVVHAHQPQVAALADVYQCHFLSRVAAERQSLESGASARARLVRLQQQAVLFAEDHYYRRWNPRTRMLFNSEMTRRDFHRLYSQPEREDVLLCPLPAPDFPTPDERQRARAALVGETWAGIVVGYLGGLHERKGYRQLVDALAGADDLFLLLGGHRSEDFQSEPLRGRYRALGYQHDTRTFFAACDVFVVPSLYEPFGLVAADAAAHGVPVIATETVGALPHLQEHGAGELWRAGTPLAPLVREMAARREACRAGSRQMLAEHNEGRYGERLMAVYDDVLREKQIPARAPGASGRTEPTTVRS